MQRRLQAVFLALICWLAPHQADAESDIDRAAAALRQGQYDTAIRLLKPPAQSGSATAQLMLGTAYAAMTSPDYRAAYRWTACAAGAGTELGARAEAESARLAEATGLTAAELNAMMRAAGCGIGPLPWDVAYGYHPVRHGGAQHVAMIAGDVCIMGVLFFAGVMGAEWLAASVMTILAVTGDWFPAALSTTVWLLIAHCAWTGWTLARRRTAVRAS